VLFVSREVDAAITWEPFASQAELKFKNFKILFDGAAEWRKLNGSQPLYPANVVIARQGFIDDRPAELRQFLAAYVRTIRFINDDPDHANEAIGKEIQLDKETVAAARRRIDYVADVDPAADLATLEWSKRLGYLKQVPRTDGFFDLRFLPAK
jgi:NitT/TauT family transport system substrate-binding protein